VFAGLFLATLIFNWIISKRLWQPFRESLLKIRNIELQKMEAIHFEETNTEEFNELNASLNTMAQKIQSDYRNMNEFTENAAHEMQTPLAVAQTKLELLLQDSSLQDSQVQAIAQATTALSRLSKLNQSLLLLAKIENNQYEAQAAISLSEVAQKYLRLFDEIIKDKQIIIETDFADPFEVRLHPFLADSLVSNLVGNAVKYNEPGGRISIKVSNIHFCISNTSRLSAISADQLFQRFQTAGDHANASNGLGLAIVKKIIDTNHLRIAYRHEDNLHHFCIEKQRW